MSRQVKKKQLYTFDEYLALEDSSELRYEFLRGEVFCKAGAKANHNLTVLNVVATMRDYFRGKGCRVFAEYIKLELISKEYYVYPDVMVTCHKDDLHNDLIMKHPVILVEVLSKSTTVYDLNTKLDHYLKLASLLYYLIVSQTEHKVKIYERKGNLWNYRIVEGLESQVYLEQLKINLSLKEIYEDVKLEPFKDLP